MVMRSIPVAVVLVLIATACGEPENPISERGTSTPTTTVVSQPAPETELDAARSRWVAAGLATYRYVFQEDCGECDQTANSPHEIVVWDGETSGPDGAPSIERMFAAIEEAVAAGRDVEATYDPATGHPTEVWIDREARAYDGGTHWIVADLSEGLPGGDPSLERLEAARTLWEETRPEAYAFSATLVCDCLADGTMDVVVEGNRVVDWTADFEEEAQVSPVTMDVMFDDLAELAAAAEAGLVEDGIRFTGSAEYHAEFGYPVWVGLDIEVLDAESDLSYLPPRLIYTVTDFAAVDPAGFPADDLAGARQRWMVAGVADYEYELTVHDIESASFSDPYLVTVHEGTVSVSSGGDPVSTIGVPAYSVDEMFDLIELWRQAGSRVEVLYDESWGFPVFVSVQTSDAEVPQAWSIGRLEGR